MRVAVILHEITASFLSQMHASSADDWKKRVRRAQVAFCPASHAGQFAVCEYTKEEWNQSSPQLTEDDGEGGWFFTLTYDWLNNYPCYVGDCTYLNNCGTCGGVFSYTAIKHLLTEHGWVVIDVANHHSDNNAG